MVSVLEPVAPSICTAPLMLPVLAALLVIVMSSFEPGALMVIGTETVSSFVLPMTSMPTEESRFIVPLPAR